MLTEVWKPIEDFPEYEVSTLGNIRSHKRINDVYLKTYYNGDGEGIVKVFLYTPNKERRSRSVANIVAKAFLPNPEGLYFVKHKDGDPRNNRVDNLRWAMSRSRPRKRVKVVETGELFASLTEVSHELSVDMGLLSRVMDNPHFTAGGFHYATATEAEWEASKLRDY